MNYKIPSEPSAQRVYIWRKLKRIGAIFYQDAVWVLPKNPHTHEQFQWLAVEITENGGEATLWEADIALRGQDELLEKQFTEQVNQGYSGILAKLEEADPDLESLSRQFQLIHARDYFHSELGQKIRERLLEMREGDL